MACIIRPPTHNKARYAPCKKARREKTNASRKLHRSYPSGGSPLDRMLKFSSSNVPPSLSFSAGFTHSPAAVSKMRSMRNRQDPEYDTLDIGCTRELFEELGILLCHETLDVSRFREARRPFWTSSSLAFDCRTLWRGGQPFIGTEIGHWITPPFSPVFFDAAYFVLEASEDLPNPEIWPGELVDGGWWRVRDALPHTKWVSYPSAIRSWKHFGFSKKATPGATREKNLAASRARLPPTRGRNGRRPSHASGQDLYASSGHAHQFLSSGRKGLGLY